MYVTCFISIACMWFDIDIGYVICFISTWFDIDTVCHSTDACATRDSSLNTIKADFL